MIWIFGTAELRTEPTHTARFCATCGADLERVGIKTSSPALCGSCHAHVLDYDQADVDRLVGEAARLTRQEC